MIHRKHMSIFVFLIIFIATAGTATFYGLRPLLPLSQTQPQPQQLVQEAPTAQGTIQEPQAAGTAPQAQPEVPQGVPQQEVQIPSMEIQTGGGQTVTTPPLVIQIPAQVVQPPPVQQEPQQAQPQTQVQQQTQTQIQTQQTMPQPEQKPDLSSLEVISPFPNKGLGRAYKANDYKTNPDGTLAEGSVEPDESNSVDIGLICRDSDGNPTKDRVVSISVTAPDGAQNKTLQGTGSVTTIYVDGAKRTVPYYPFHYDFRKPGQHVVTFSCAGMSKTVELTAE